MSPAGLATRRSLLRGVAEQGYSTITIVSHARRSLILVQCGSNITLAETAPVTAGESLVGCLTPPEQLAVLLDAGRKYRSFKYWDKVRVGSSESRLTGQGFNAVKFDPQKPARTIRRNDGNLGMRGAMHWLLRRRFSLPEFKRFASFPDEFAFAGEFDEGIRQAGNCVPPLFIRAIAGHIRHKILAAVRDPGRAA